MNFVEERRIKEISAPVNAASARKINLFQRVVAIFQPQPDARFLSERLQRDAGLDPSQLEQDRLAKAPLIR